MKKADVFIIAELDWDGLHCQSHVMAMKYAAAGHKVYYINRTLQRWPTIQHFMRRFFPSAKSGYVNTYRERPENISVLTIMAGPPVRWVRWLNRIMIKRTLGSVTTESPLVITYVPTYTAQDIINFLNPSKTAYVCYHNFDATPGLPADVLRSERQLVKKVDLLFADAAFLQKRLQAMQDKEVYRSMPGVYYDKFKQAERNEEGKNIRKIAFFGGVGPHMELDFYAALAEKYEVYFIGVISDAVSDKLHPDIKILPPVSNHELPSLLREMDALAIFYRPSKYIDGVIPAKLFECLACGKPLLVSGLKEVEIYSDVVYIIENEEHLLTTIINIPVSFDESRKQKQREIAAEASWDNRFMQFKQIIDAK